jgi:hypothetical protein
VADVNGLTVETATIAAAVEAAAAKEVHLLLQ